LVANGDEIPCDPTKPLWHLLNQPLRWLGFERPALGWNIICGFGQGCKNNEAAQDSHLKPVPGDSIFHPLRLQSQHAIRHSTFFSWVH